MNHFKNYFLIVAVALSFAFMIVAGFQLHKISKQFDAIQDRSEKTFKLSKLVAEVIIEFGEETFYHQMENIKFVSEDTTLSFEESRQEMELHWQTMRALFKKDKNETTIHNKTR